MYDELRLKFSVTFWSKFQDPGGPVLGLNDPAAEIPRVAVFLVWDCHVLIQVEDGPDDSSLAVRGLVSAENLLPRLNLISDDF